MNVVSVILSELSGCGRAHATVVLSISGRNIGADLGPDGDVLPSGREVIQ